MTGPCNYNMLVCPARDKLRADIEELKIALRRIISLGDKNVEKYARQIAQAALASAEPKGE